jgi:hypothetical protein
MPDFALGNPFLKPGQSRKMAEQEAAGAKDLKGTQDWSSGGRGDQRKGDGARRLSQEEKFLRHQLLRWEGYDDGLDQAGLEHLLGQAFGIDDSRLPIVDCKTGATAPSAPSSAPAKTEPTGEPGNAFQSSIGNPQSSIHGLAAQLWERLVLFRNWRESEARELDETLERTSGPQGVETWDPKRPPLTPPWSEPGPEDVSPHWQWRALAALVLAVFAGDIIPLTKADAWTERAKRTIYNFMVRHYRQRRGFSFLRPDPHYEPPVLTWAADVGGRIRARYAGGPRVLPTVLRL